ncbi:MAG: citramalate synthase [Planctomycetes bacterium]|nr:citramalate synthase [Planctomycetota bacterium]
MDRVRIYDATLRDGTQGEGMSLSVEDKLLIVGRLDDVGIDYIEGGFPGSNPKDREFFELMRKQPPKHSKLVAFGSTRRARVKASDDPGLRAIAQSGAPAAAIFGKTWGLHVREVLRTSLENNLNMIEDSVAFLKAAGLEVVYDAEHFFDGYRDSAEYALETLKAAARGGADWLVLCDTNGGTLTWDVVQAVGDVMANVGTPVGIHAHNDSGLGAANSLAAVRCGATQVHGTINGYGERCGNADLCTIVPTLELKMNKRCLPEGGLHKLTELSLYVAEIANQALNETSPYVGKSAFAHKGGMHVDAIQKNPLSYEHVDPKRVGNRRRVLLSELSGRSLILDKAREYAPGVNKDSHEIRRLFDELGERELQGYLFEGAEGSFQLMLMKAFGKHEELFHRVGFRIIVDKDIEGRVTSEATIKIGLGDRQVHTAAEGGGPVDALDTALRKALREFYPEIRNIHLTDYKVRVLEGADGTASKVRVLMESTDGQTLWGTVGVSENIIEASWQALVDSLEYGLLYKKARNGNAGK